MTAVTFPDVVRAVIPFLSARLTALGKPAPVSSRVPTQRPARFVRVTLSGGSRLDIWRQQPLLLVECWDASEPDAYDLAAACASELEAATRSGQPIAAGVWLSGEPDDFSVPVNFPDPLSASPRFQFTCTPIVTAV